MLVLKTMLITLCVLASLESAFSTALGDEDSFLNNRVIQDLIKRVNVLEARDKLHQERDSAQQQRIEDLESVIRKQQLKMEELQQLLPDPTQPEGHASEELATETSTESTVGSTKKRETGYRTRRQTPKVAFSAVLYQSRINLGVGQTVPFDHVETNIGNAYDSYYGVFTAPVAGTYVFFTTAMAVGNGETSCTIVVNGIGKVGVLSYGSSSHADQSSQMIVIYLRQGDDVAVQNAQHDYGVYGNKFSSFSGYLIG